MHTAAAIKTAPSRYAAFKMIEANMAAAFLAGADAVVEVTLRGERAYTISGAPEHVARAHTVAVAAGMMLDSSEYDDELGETFAYYSA